MGRDSKRLPLPAPTDSGSERNSLVVPTDLATDISRRTDRTSYSIPDDGTPITLPTRKLRLDPGRPNTSQASLLIEYFEAEAEGNKTGRPNVRVKVHQGARKHREPSSERRPSYTRHVSLSGRSSSREHGKRSRSHSHSRVSHNPTDPSMEGARSDVSSRTHNHFVPPTSDISSMPADSMLEAQSGFERHDDVQAHSQPSEPQRELDTLKAPTTRRSRSVSKERITKKVLEKLAREESPDEIAAAKSRTHRRRPTTSSVEADGDVRHRRRRSEKSADDYSTTESSLAQHRDSSSVSGLSKSSLNPKLLQTVEDVVKRLILPEIETIKRQQSVRDSRATRDSTGTESSYLTGEQSSAMSRPKVVLNRDDKDPGVTLSGDTVRRKKHRRSSKESASGSKPRSSRHDSADSVGEEKERARRHKSSSTRDDAIPSAEAVAATTALTTAALRSHNSRSSLESPDRERRERRKKRREGHSKTQSGIDQPERPADDDYVATKRRVKLPMDSEIQDSELTRESIMSAETAGEDESKDDPVNNSMTLVREAPRISPRHVETGASHAKESEDDERLPAIRAVRSRGQLSSPRSDRSLSSKAAKHAALAAAGLGGAAGAMYGHHDLDRSRPSSRNSRPAAGKEQSKGNPRELSPVRSEDYMPLDTKKAMQAIKAFPSTVDAGTDSKPSSRGKDGGRDTSTAVKSNPKAQFQEDRRFSFEPNLSDQLETGGQQDSPLGEAMQDATPSAQAADPPHRLRAVDTNNPEISRTPQPVESQVASLLNPSSLSSHREGPDRRSIGVDTLASSDLAGNDDRETHNVVWSGDNHSAERWAALREAARAGSNGNLKDGELMSSPGGSEELHLGTSGVPNAQDPLPEIGHAYDDDRSDAVTTPSQARSSGRRSVLEGPLGDEHENRGQWPYEPTPPAGHMQSGFTSPEGHNQGAEAAMLGAAAGLGIDAATHRHAQSQQTPTRGVPLTGSPQHSRGYRGEQSRNRFDSSTPNALKDEGYISAPNPRSGGAPSPDVGGSPLSFSKPPPRLFDENDAERMYRRQQEPYQPPGRGHARNMSGGSHGMGSPLYDASTGRGINNIQSKDIVALMDHLTVRDGQRNARDTEILVTLVRSATDMRNSFEDMKKFVKDQNDINMARTDSASDKTASRIMGGSGLNSSLSPRTTRSASADEVPTKKKNIFQRALKGLGSKNTNDLSKMEDMLNQLLEEVEALRAAQGVQGPTATPPRQRELDSFERLRAPADPGYEPSGHAGTSTPSRSGNFSMSPQSRPAAQAQHSGGGVDNRISTVYEEDEDDHVGHGEIYEEPDGMLTPTQEAQNAKSLARGVSMESPRYDDGDLELTPPSASKHGRKQSSGSSSMFATPKVSRWSKTTTNSSVGNRNSYQAHRALSDASRSGSDINVLPDNDDYSPQQDDRLRSNASLDRDLDPRGLSPESLEDPKYKANRNSLTLQHPQPRQGPTQTQRSLMESQAQVYDPRHSNESLPSPNHDALGAYPTLSRFSRMPVQAADSRRSTLSPPSSEGSPATRAAPSYAPAQSSRLAHATHADDYDDDYSSEHSEDVSEHGAATTTTTTAPWIEPVPLARKQSPYSPGGLLAPIEERYSLERTRSSMSATPATTAGFLDDERSATPTAAPRPAVGAEGKAVAGRSLTGPREMPGRAAGRAGSRG